MRRVYLVCLFLFLTVTFLFSQSSPSSIDPKTSGDAKAQARILDAQILDNYGKLPLSFEANHGQADARVKFLSRTNGYTLFLTADEAVLAFGGKKQSSPQGLKPPSLTSAQKIVDGDGAKSDRSDRTMGGVLRMKLRGANAAAKISGVDELAGKSNYFIGNDPAKWRTGVPTYAKVKYEGIYSGIDLVYYGNRSYGKEGQLEYDFIVAPGADTRQIGFEVRGAKRILRDAQGELVFKVGEGEVRWHKPVVYQEKDGARELVAARYVVTDRNRVGFVVAKYDASKALYIDPLIYSTYLGGSNSDEGLGIAVDSAGNAYVAGATNSINFPTTPGAFQTSCGGGCEYDNAFVTKFNPTGSALVYSTYLGGSADTGALGIAVDGAGNAYVTGGTNCTDFPTTPGAFQTTLGGEYDAFVTKLNPAGSALVYSTYLGGSAGTSAFAIAVDGAGNAYVTGYTNSTDFPTTPGAFQTTNNGGDDAFVSKFNPTGSALVYSTYIGGKKADEGSGIAVDGEGNAYITGTTYSNDFPVTPGAFQQSCRRCLQPDAFVTKLNPTGSALVYSTHLGGSQWDLGSGIAVDSAGDAYVAGSTSSDDFPVTSGAFQTVCNLGRHCQAYGDAFVTKLNPTGSALVYSTYLGGSGGDGGAGIAVGSTGNAYVTGTTDSSNFPITPGAFQTTGCCVFVTELNPTGSGLVYSTYLGGTTDSRASGIAVDSAGNAYVTGSTTSTNFPTTPGAFQTTYGGGDEDAFVTKLQLPAVATTTALTSSPNPSIYGEAVTFTAVVASSAGAPPNGEAVMFMEGTTALGTGSLSDGSASLTTSMLPVATNSVTAAYDGDSNLGGSTSNVVNQVVNKATTTTALASSLNPSNVGQPVTFTASVTPQFGGTVTGKVTYYDGTTELKVVTLSGGTAKYRSSKLTAGTHNITATYGGSVSFSGSSASLTQTVN